MYLFLTVSIFFQYVIKNFTSFTKSSPKNTNKFFCHTQTMKIKVMDSSNSENKLYSTFAVNNMTSELTLISDRHKTKLEP